MVKERNWHLVAKDPNESDRYESCIVERSTTKSRHVRYGAWEMLGEGEGWHTNELPRYLVSWTTPAFPILLIRSRLPLGRIRRRIRERENAGPVAGLLSLARWLLILKPFICPRTYRVLHRRHRFT